ncbi:MAG: exodeoxyribonuclease VII small subunit [Chloroflexi bacterium]|nr:exodeoxyribonuclease VII small subunit [Chloroflexota bacterium]
MPKKTSAPPNELSFEKAFAELEAIVAKLESGQLSLDEALAWFERGQALAAQCSSLLDAAELKVKQLSPGGDLEDIEPFGAEES